MRRVSSLRLGNVNFILFSSLFLKETHTSNTYLIVCAKKESQKTKQKRKKKLLYGIERYGLWRKRTVLNSLCKRSINLKEE
uniref:Putative secreted protein n=1 Tax=Anopheles darlingi TaxID=43151 RepID=A0A2M4DC25_ANODA